MDTHTPAPWKRDGGHVTAGEAYVGYLQDFGDEDSNVATAAPTLLKALETAVGHVPALAHVPIIQEAFDQAQGRT